MPKTNKRKRGCVMWLLVAGVLLVLLLISPIVVGKFLPEDYHGRVSATYAASPAEVWAALEDHERTPITGSMWRGTEEIESENGLPAWVEDMGSSKATIRTVEREMQERLVRDYSDSVVPMTARVELSLEETDAGTRVTGVNHMVIRDGTWHVPIFRFIMTVTGGADRSLKDYFGGIGRAVEAEPAFE